MLDRLIKWTPKRHQQWEAIRVKGRRHHVIRNGVLQWGGTMVVLMTLWNLVFMPGRNVLSVSFILFIVLTNVIIYPLGGVLLGLWTWSMNESQFQRHQQQNATHSDAHPSDHQS